jgi:hypothetical protein
MFDDCVLLLYSHTEYHDVLVACISRLLKHFVPMKMALCINNATAIKEHFKGKIDFAYVHEYVDNGPYFYQRLSPLLEKIEEPYVLFNMDNNILIDDVKVDIIEEAFETMKERNIDHFHLMTGGMIVSDSKDKHFFEASSIYLMSVLSAFWKRSSFYSLCKTFPDHNFRCSECDAIQYYMRANCKCYCLFPRDSKNLCPFDETFTDIYPAIHAVTGRLWWLMPSQKTHIENIAKEYNIDLTKIGVRFTS